jgi:type I restriction enzyme S subunit
MFGDPTTNSKEWTMKTVGEILTIKGGKRLPKGSQYSFIPTPYRYLRITDVKDGRININSMKFLSEEVQKKDFTLYG